MHDRLSQFRRIHILSLSSPLSAVEIPDTDSDRDKATVNWYGKRWFDK